MLLPSANHAHYGRGLACSRLAAGGSVQFLDALGDAVNQVSRPAFDIKGPACVHEIRRFFYCLKIYQSSYL